MNNPYEPYWDTESKFPASEFIKTSVSTLVFDTIENTRGLEWNASLVGAPGVGKTQALNAYVREHTDAALIEVTPTLGNSAIYLLAEIARQVGVQDHGNAREIEMRIKKYYLDKTIIIFDEAQHINIKNIRTILHLSFEDKGQLSFVFCGNSEVLKKGKHSSAAFGQIDRRVWGTPSIDGISDNDVDAIANHAGVDEIEAFKLLRKVGATFHARGVAKTLKMAAGLASGKSIGLEEVREAISFLPQYQSALRKK